MGAVAAAAGRHVRARCLLLVLARVAPTGLCLLVSGVIVQSVGKSKAGRIKGSTCMALSKDRSTGA